MLHAEAIPFAKTHNMAALLDMVLPLEPSWEMMRPDLQSLTAMAVNFRYPGRSADKAAAREAVVIARTVRAHARLYLGLKS